MAAVHPRLAVNGISSMLQSLPDDLTMWAELGVTRAGIISPKLDATGWPEGRQLVLDAGLTVSSVSCAPEETEKALEFAGSVGAQVFYAVSGSFGTIPWEEAARRYCRQMAPLVVRAAELGVKLAVEATNPLRSDVSFVHSVRDAFDLAQMAGIGVCLDFYSSWYERGLSELLRKDIDRVALVQICDYTIGTFDTPNRRAIGDGDIPVERLMAMALDAGYPGLFELEILGPRIEEEGYRAPIARSLERASEILERLGA